MDDCRRGNGGCRADDNTTELKEYFKETLDNKLDPVIARLDTHETILIGQSKRNGIVGDVNKMKWLTSSGIIALIWKVYDFFGTSK